MTAGKPGQWSQLAIYNSAILLVGGVTFLGWLVDRTDALSVVLPFFLAFVGYAAIVFIHPINKRSLKWLIGVGIVLRLIMVAGFPLLSDDVYRFLWDGYLINAGENPFAQLPGYYLEDGNAVPGLTQALYDNLNSPEYYTIYPPIAQGVFTVATWLSTGNWMIAATIIQVFLFTCELGTAWLLYRLFTTQFTAYPTANLLLYWLNPLIIVEICGNLHFEGAMVFFLLLAYYLLRGSNWITAGAAMAASVASKLLPLLLLPYLIRRLWGKRSFSTFLRFSVAFAVITTLLFLPLIAVGFLDGFSSSLDLYFRKFEFNASLYYLARAYGYYDVGWNKIAEFGPALAKFAAVSILALALLDGRSDWRSLPEGWLFAFVIYLLCATTVHPWYLSVPLVLCCFTPWRFPVVWSGLITLTYVSYGTVPYEENLYLVAAEYVITVAFAVWEWRYRVNRNLRSRTPLPA